MIALGGSHLPLGRTGVQRVVLEPALEHRELLIRGVAESKECYFLVAWIGRLAVGTLARANRLLGRTRVSGRILARIAHVVIGAGGRALRSLSQLNVAGLGALVAGFGHVSHLRTFGQ